MTLRTRFVGTLSAVVLVSQALVLIVAGAQINASQERQFDDALRRESWQEIHEVAEGGGRELRISPRLGPSPDDLGPLTKYAVLYDIEGRVLDATPSWSNAIPALSDLPDSFGDLYHHHVHLRGLVSEVPGHPGTKLLLAAPRSDLDGDASYLRRTMGVVFGLAMIVTVMLTSAVVRRLTTVHERIARVARTVAAGDLEARVGPVRGTSDLLQLASDIDTMIERMAALLRSQSDFIAHAAHELRSPLTSLYGELSHTARREREPAEYSSAIAEAIEATRRLMMLADDLLALARVDRGPRDHPRAVALRDLIEEALAVVGPDARNRSLRFDLELGDLTVLGRSLDLARLFRNLIENAVSHAPEGSTVGVKARRASDLVEVSIRDLGPGVAAADAPYIFQPFFRGTLERASGRRGTGLGLAIATEIAKQHPRGRIDLIPVDGPGACFVVTLPIAPPAPHRPAPPQPK